MSSPPIIAVIDLTPYSALRLLFKRQRCNVLYFNKKIGRFFVSLLSKKHCLKECRLDYYEAFYEQTEKEKLYLSEQLADHKNFSRLIEKLADIFQMDKFHIRFVFIKRFVKLLHPTMGMILLVKRDYKPGDNVQIWLDNCEIFKRLRLLNYVPCRSNGLCLLNMAIALYCTVWPFFYIFLFLINNLRRTVSAQQIRVVFRQKFSKRFGWNPEFDAFYRYFKTRNDVAYHCVKKGDEIYHSVASDGKPVFTTSDLRISFSEGVRFIFIFCKLMVLVIRSALPQRIMFWIMVLQMFQEYMLTRSILRKFTPKYMIRIRPEMYEYHPIITGTCEQFGCKHIGYKHGPPVFFIANYAIADFHYTGVMGKSDIVDIYRAYAPKNQWEVLGPIAADIAYDYPIENNGERVITFFSTSTYGFDPEDRLFREAIFSLVCFLKTKSNIRLVYREKNVHSTRLSYVTELCDKNHIRYDVEIHTAGKTVMDFSALTIKKSELIMVLGWSTGAWECLSLKRKLIVYSQPWIRHALEHFSPNLVVKNPVDFNKTMTWLWSIPYPEYIRKTDHIVRQISKKANGKMVKEYFEEFIGIGA